MTLTTNLFQNYTHFGGRGVDEGGDSDEQWVAIKPRIHRRGALVDVVVDCHSPPTYRSGTLEFEGLLPCLDALLVESALHQFDQSLGDFAGELVEDHLAFVGEAVSTTLDPRDS